MASEAAVETTYYKDGEVHITNTRAIFGQSTFVLANITSVASDAIIYTHAAPLLLLVAGALMAAWGLYSSNPTCFVIPGVLVVIASMVWDKLRRNQYIVKIGTAGSEQRAYASTDKKEIDKIVAALNVAIVKRG